MFNSLGWAAKFRDPAATAQTQPWSLPAAVGGRKSCGHSSLKISKHLGAPLPQQQLKQAKLEPGQDATRPAPQKQQRKAGHPRKGVQDSPRRPAPTTTTPLTITTHPSEEDTVVPESWPKVGQGMYALLAPERADIACLVDVDDGDAFSHFTVGMGFQQVLAALEVKVGA
jgi:hypothetical protein